MTPPPIGAKREATCAGCGVKFTSTNYSKGGWSRYHSPGCRAHQVSRAKRAAAIAVTDMSASKVTAAVAVAASTPSDTPTAPDPVPPPTPAVGTDVASPANERAVTLPSGATLTLTVSGNVLTLGRPERDLVFLLVDTIEAYETGRSGQPRQSHAALARTAE